MCNVNPIIPEIESARNTSDLPVCPIDGTPLFFSTSARRVACTACGLELTLSPQEARDLSNALAGLDPDLPVALFLAEIARRELTSVETELTAATQEADTAYAGVLAAQTAMRRALQAYRAAEKRATG